MISHQRKRSPRKECHFRGWKIRVRNGFIVEKKTLVFDLDETLIHCVDNIELEKPDKVLLVNIPGVGIKRVGLTLHRRASTSGLWRWSVSNLRTDTSR